MSGRPARRARGAAISSLALIAALPPLAALALPVARGAEPPPAATTDDVKVDDATAELIDQGLRYLASKQKDDGSWRAENNDHGVAITAYALHAFLAAGHVPGE